MPDLAIVIVNYNTKDLLLACLDSIFASEDGFSSQVIVVDNASTDGSAVAVEERYPQVDLARNLENLGYAQANNQGLRRAEADYYLLLNPDTVLPRAALANMLRFMEERPEVAIAGPKLVMADGRLDLACRRSFPSPEVAFYRMVGLSRLFPRSRRFGRYNLTYLDPDEITEVDSVVGAFMLIRAEALEQVGYLDEAFFMYGEDLDLAYRAKAAGWKVYYNPQVEVLHYKRSASTQNPKVARTAFYQAQHLFYKKHYAETTPRWLHWLILAGIVLRGGVTVGREVLFGTPPQGASEAAR